MFNSKARVYNEISKKNTIETIINKVFVWKIYSLLTRFPPVSSNGHKINDNRLWHLDNDINTIFRI